MTWETGSTIVPSLYPLRPSLTMSVWAVGDRHVTVRCFLFADAVGGWDSFWIWQKTHSTASTHRRRSTHSRGATDPGSHWWRRSEAPVCCRCTGWVGATWAETVDVEVGWHTFIVERGEDVALLIPLFGSSVVDCRTRNRVSPGVTGQE